MFDFSESESWEVSTIPANTTTSLASDILQHLSDRRALQLLPVFIVFGAVLLVGLFGNSLIVYVYLSKFKKSFSRTAIVTLAIFDLMSNLVAIPEEIVDLRFSFNYKSDVMCRVSRAFATFPNIASGILLAAVALDRYRLICLPHKATLYRNSARKYVIGACALSLLFTWPTVLVYGTKTINTDIANVTGKECSTNDRFKTTKIPLAYNTVLSVVFIAAFTTMSVSYALVVRQVCRQGQFRKTLRQLRNRNVRSATSELEPSDLDADKDLSNAANAENIERQDSRYLRIDRLPKGENPSDNPSEQSLPTSPTTMSAPQRPLSRVPSLFRRLRKQRSVEFQTNARTQKTTFMLCLISIVFVLSYLPHLVVKLARAINKNFLDDASTSSLIIYNLCARSYVINNFANIFVYSFCSLRFRNECKELFKRLCLWFRLKTA